MRGMPFPLFKIQLRIEVSASRRAAEQRDELASP
jgi:hypothetical protein